MRARLSVIVAASVLSGWLFASPASAQPVRAVVLVKEIREGQLQAHSALETAVVSALQRRKVKVVGLDETLRAQRFAFADTLEAGELPKELSAMSADVVVAVALVCSRSAASLVGTSLQAHHCVLSQKAVRLDSGEVLLAEDAELIGHGLTSAMAVQSLMRARVPEWLAAATERWQARLVDAAGWEVDLNVTRIADHKTAEALASVLATLEGVESARLVVFRTGLSLFRLTGQGAGALARLVRHVEDAPDLALRVTFHSGRTVHAEFDFAKAYGRRVVVMAVTDAGGREADLGPSIVSASMLNLPYLLMAHSRPLAATPESEANLARRLRKRASSLAVPWMLAVRLLHRDKGWHAGLRLIDVASGRTLAAGHADGAGPALAADRAVRSFDRAFRAALGDAEKRAAFDLESAVELAGSADDGVVVEAFATAGEDPRMVRLALQNPGRRVVEDAHVRVRAAGQVAFERRLSSLAPGTSIELPIRLEPAAVGEAGPLLLGAEVSFRVGDRRGRTQAYTSVPGADGAQRRDSAALPERYRESMARANELYRQGRWEAARRAAARAHRLYPNAHTLRVLGMLSFDAGEYREAESLLREALRHAGPGLTRQERLEVESMLQRIQRFAARSG